MRRPYQLRHTEERRGSLKPFTKFFVLPSNRMRIRTQLIIAAFILAVVPLAAIVTWSYHSSREALENAYRQEASRLTRQMDRRLAAIRADLDARLTYVSAITVPGEGVTDSIAAAIGDAAPFVDSLEFRPVPVATGEEPAAKPAAKPRQEEARVTSPSPAPLTPPTPAVAGVAGVAAVGAVEPVAPAPPPEAIIIEIPEFSEFPRHVMSEEQLEQVREFTRLAAALSSSTLDSEEREDLQKEMAAAEKELREIAAADRRAFRQRLEEAKNAATRLHVVPAPPAPAAATAAAPVVAASGEAAVAVPAPKLVIRKAAVVEQDAREKAARSELILGRKFQKPVRNEGQVVGSLTPRIKPDQVIRHLLGTASEEGDEIPFAIDREGTVYTRNGNERAQLDALAIPDRVRRGASTHGIQGWIVSTSTDPQSGLKIGVARPVGGNLDDLRRTAGRNFMLGLGVIFLAMIGIVPLTNHLTRDVKLVTDGAERISKGDLMTRVPVKTSNELGLLARAFNRMAEDLSLNQQKLLEQERARKEQEMQQRLMAVEYERKSDELEDARRFQLSMLPKELPRVTGLDIDVLTRTATEVGGDYYDFHLDDRGLSVTIGDATGHGAKAGTMVTVVKTLFSQYGGTTPPADFMRDAAETIKRMDLGRMAMALSLARFEGRRVTVTSAGMPPMLVHRAASGTVEEIALHATPLGTLGTDYEQRILDLAPSDTVLLMSDGFPELMNAEGQQLGYVAAADRFARAAAAPSASEVIRQLGDAVREWHGDSPPNDDVTFVVVRAV